jgi:hypothetical protein
MDRAIELLISATTKKSTKVVAGTIYPDVKLDSANSRLDNELHERQGPGYNYKLGLRTAIQIMQITGDLSALDRIESLFKRVAFSLPEPKGKITDLMDMTADLTKEFGEHIGAVAMAMKDNRLTEKEARKCLEEVKDVIEAGIRIKAYLERYEANPPSPKGYGGTGSA